MAVSEKNIAKFISKWQGRGKEKQDDQAYWTDLLSYIFELTDITNRIEPQKDVVGPDGNIKWIDIYIPETRVLIEQKSLNIDLSKPQAGHDGMTPYEQAKMYDNCLRLSEKARWIVTSNFAEIWVYDMEAKKPEETVSKISLDNLLRDYKKLSFLYDPNVEQIKREFEISKEAGDEIGKIYKALIKQYPATPSDDDLRNLNTFCVRLVFCYYAEDAGLFEDELFSNYLKSFNPQHLRTGLRELFRILNTPDTARDPFEERILLKFPYVNGGLFDGSNNIIPQFDENTQIILIEAADFNWNDISPTIFGAIFESTLNQETRRNNGMHYTAVENIHKVIDPLFLDDLKSELEEIKASKQPNVRVQKLRSFQDKLSSLNFLDPACGSGNFLTETYLSLRKLENEAIKELSANLMFTNGENDTLIKVQLDQFYGIEINDFAVSVARTALWIAENQMMEQTKKLIVNATDLTFLPLSSLTHIKEENALRYDWKKLLSPADCSYIMGNPPFIGYSLQKPEQKEDIRSIYIDEEGKPYKTAGKIDYVAGWYYKASQYMVNTNIRTAFVSTNSITQGEQVASVWKPLYDLFNIHIDFAYKTFRWDSEASIKAHVHCVIVGFSVCSNNLHRMIYDGDNVSRAQNINAYLIDADDVFIPSRSNPLCNVPSMSTGNRPADGGHLIIEEDEYDEFIRKEPRAIKYIRRLAGSEEYINNKQRYCLWLVDASPAEIRQMPEVMKRIELCRQDRLSGAPDRQKLADTPTLFRETINPESYVLVPRVSSERRKYIPLGFVDATVIPTDSAVIIPDATIYHLGVLESSVHMAWMRAVAGRLEMRYRYSKDIVYNNFPWPDPSHDQKAKIEQTAQAILDARALYQDSSLADLYDPLIMPSEVRKAHNANDKAVMKAYGFKDDMTESEIVAELIKMYQKLTED